MSFQPQRPHYPKAPKGSVLGRHFFQIDKYSALFSLTSSTSDLGGEPLHPWVVDVSLFLVTI